MIVGVSYRLNSQGEFSKDVSPMMSSIAAFLTANGCPSPCELYPYFAYIYDQSIIPSSYAIFNSTDVVVKDGQLE
jgi:hypothetical protein